MPTDFQVRCVRWLMMGMAGLGLGPVLMLLLWAATYRGDALDPPRDGLGFVRHFLHYGVWRGWSAGSPETHGGQLPRDVQVGDVILCGNPQAVYGRWSHVTMVLDDHRVLHQDVLRGMGVSSLLSLQWYDRIQIIRVGSAASRAAAATQARRFVGTMFNLMAHRDDPRQWSCARAVRAAYAQVGIELCDERFWVTPQAIRGALP